MCGFLFHYSNNIKKKSKYEIFNIKSDLKSRGPDNFSFIQKESFSFFFSRLSIIDLNQRSDQPFTDNNKRYYLVFNGEIYNFLELKKKLKIEGIKFKTESDTEVLFQLLVHRGIKETLKVIEGMFSFIFLDTKKKTIYGARDHFGQKPFYYNKSSDQFLASTNINPILRNLKKEPKNLNSDSVIHYLCSNGLIPTTKTFFKEIASLPAGNYITITGGKFKINKYFQASDLFDKQKYLEFKRKNEDEIIKMLDLKIKKAIKNHLISDARVGLTCSGGIDSSLIVKYANDINKSFTIFTNVSPGIEKLSKIVPKVMQINKINKNRSICKILFFYKVRSYGFYP